jgi:hypothetical protein
MALWWYSERFVVITRQLQAAKCSLSSQLFGHIFTLLENLRFPYCCTQGQQKFVRLVCSALGPCIKNLLFNFREWSLSSLVITLAILQEYEHWILETFNVVKEVAEYPTIPSFLRGNRISTVQQGAILRYIMVALYQPPYIIFTICESVSELNKAESGQLYQWTSLPTILSKIFVPQNKIHTGSYWNFNFKLRSAVFV